MSISFDIIHILNILVLVASNLVELRSDHLIERFHFFLVIRVALFQIVAR